MKRVSCNLTKNSQIFLFYLLTKITSHLAHSINLDPEAINKIKVI